VKVEVREQRLRFAAPVRTAYGTLHERELLILTLTASDGVPGHGEAAPLEPYDGVPLRAAREALDAYASVLRAMDDDDPAAAVGACRDVLDLPQALAAVDLALWDMAGRRAGRPVTALLADAHADAVEVNATVGALAPGEAADAAAGAARAGFRTLKLKVGTDDDATRVAAVRSAVGPDVALRLDANGAWDVEGAVRAIGALAPFDIALVEEPVHGIEALRAVRDRVTVPIAMDETASQPGAAASGATDAVCLKVAACGGITALLARAAEARAAGAGVYVASTFDGPLGIAAGVHVAAALAPLPACGLATLGAFAGPSGDSLVPAGGAIAVPQSPGLGVGP
jgi:o-succinylbenzoate synthase